MGNLGNLTSSSSAPKYPLRNRDEASNGTLGKGSRTEISKVRAVVSEAKVSVSGPLGAHSASGSLPATLGEEAAERSLGWRLPKELAMVTSCRGGEAINPEPGGGRREPMCGAGRGAAKWN